MNRRTSRTRGVHQPDIRDYAIIGDCRTAASISREGSLDWLCLPNFSSTSAFARLLDLNAGHFSIRPSARFTVERHYLPATAVLETTFETDSGIARLIDLGPISDSIGSLLPMREILRIIEGVAGSVEDLRCGNHLAMHVELELLDRVISDADRSRIQIAGEPIGDPHAQARTPVDVIKTAKIWSGQTRRVQ